MRRVIGYANGRPIWSENVEAHAVLYRGSIHGTMVTGSAGATENERARRRGPAVNAAARAAYAAKKALPVERPIGRPRLSPDIKPRGRGNPYPSEEERIAARRQSWREASRKKYAKRDEAAA